MVSLHPILQIGKWAQSFSHFARVPLQGRIEDKSQAQAAARTSVIDSFLPSPCLPRSSLGLMIAPVWPAASHLPSLGPRLLLYKIREFAWTWGL